MTAPETTEAGAAPAPETPRRSPEKVAPKSEAPAAPPRVEVKTRRVPAAFYVGLGLAAVGVVVMLAASFRRRGEP